MIGRFKDIPKLPETLARYGLPDDLDNLPHFVPSVALRVLQHFGLDRNGVYTAVGVKRLPMLRKGSAILDMGTSPRWANAIQRVLCRRGNHDDAALYNEQDHDRTSADIGYVGSTRGRPNAWSVEVVSLDDHGLPPAYGTDVAIHFWEDMSAGAKRTDTWVRKHGEDRCVVVDRVRYREANLLSMHDIPGQGRDGTWWQKLPQ